MITPNEPLVGMNCLRVPLWSSDQTFENQLEWFNWQHGCGSKSKMFVGVAFCLLELLHLPNHHSSQFIRSHPISRGTVHPFSRQYSSPFSPGTVPLPANAPAKRPHLFAAQLRKKQSAVTKTFAFSIAPTFCTIGHRGTEGWAAHGADFNHRAYPAMPIVNSVAEENLTISIMSCVPKMQALHFCSSNISAQTFLWVCSYHFNNS